MTRRSEPEDQRQSAIGDSVLDRVLAAMIVGIVLVSVLSMILFMIGTAGGWLTGTAATAVWAIAFLGLPIAVVLMIVVTIRMAIRRRREARER